MKTYHTYNDIIRSREAVEAISTLKGMGPIVGFAKGEIKSNGDIYQLVLSALPDKDNPAYSAALDRQKLWELNCTENAKGISFAGISKDGYIFLETNPTITVDISGQPSGSNKEVFLFAQHTPIDQPVVNPIVLIACWNEGASLYDFYKKNLDPYYPLAKEDRQITMAQSLTNIENLSYNELDSLVEDRCNFYKQNSLNLTLIGVYGEANDILTSSNKKENYAIVPIDGEIPFKRVSRVGWESAVEASLNRLESIIDSKITKSLTTILSELETSVRQDLGTDIVMNSLPEGSIILWEGTEIPDGWIEYTPAQGRIVIGHTSQGIQVPVSDTDTTLHTVLSTVGSTYNAHPTHPFYNTINKENLPAHRHAVGVRLNRPCFKGTQEYNIAVVDNWSHRKIDATGEFLGDDKWGNILRKHRVVQGGIDTSLNRTSDSDSSTDEQGIEQLSLSKLPPAVTLKYIKKVKSATSSTGTTTTVTGGTVIKDLKQKFTLTIKDAILKPPLLNSGFYN